MSTITTGAAAVPSAPENTTSSIVRHEASLAARAEMGRTVELLEVLHAMAITSERRMLSYYISMALAEARSIRESWKR